MLIAIFFERAFHLRLIGIYHAHMDRKKRRVYERWINTVKCLILLHITNLFTQFENSMKTLINEAQCYSSLAKS